MNIVKKPRGNKMKIKVKHYGKVFTVNAHEDIPLDELCRIFAGLAKQMGYNSEAVDRYIDCE